MPFNYEKWDLFFQEKFCFFGGALGLGLTKFNHSHNTDTRLINNTYQKKKKQNKPEGPNLTPSPGSHNDKLISDKQSYKTSQGGPK